MRLIRFACLLAALTWSANALARAAYVRSTIGSPWGTNTNEAHMTTVFGADEWDDLRFEEVDPAVLFSSAYTFVYLEGGDSTTIALLDFIEANRDAMAVWLSVGNTLFINAAPNGDPVDRALGVEDVRLIYPRHSTNPVTLVDRSHPAWVEIDRLNEGWSGGSAAHAVVAGRGLVPMLTDPNGQVHLAWLPDVGGCGTAVFGGLTPTNFWQMETNPVAMRLALLSWLQAQARDCDLDDDLIVDARDNCPQTANPDQADADADGHGDVCDFEDDLDRDGVANAVDNCPFHANADQTDGDADGLGDACDPTASATPGDLDSDGVPDGEDTCPLIANADQADGDGDGQGDACDARDDRDLDADGLQNQEDNCPFIANPAQTDSDGDGIGDVCDGSGDAGDLDGDGVADLDDNCPVVANADQADADEDGQGDACDARDDRDLDGDGVPNAEDPCPFGSDGADGGAEETCAQASGGGGGGGCAVAAGRSGGRGLALCLVLGFGLSLGRRRLRA